MAPSTNLNINGGRGQPSRYMTQPNRPKVKTINRTPQLRERWKAPIMITVRIRGMITG